MKLSSVDAAKVCIRDLSKTTFKSFLWRRRLTACAVIAVLCFADMLLRPFGLGPIVRIAKGAMEGSGKIRKFTVIIMKMEVCKNGFE